MAVRSDGRSRWPFTSGCWPSGRAAGTRAWSAGWSISRLLAFGVGGVLAVRPVRPARWRGCSSAGPTCSTGWSSSRRSGSGRASLARRSLQRLVVYHVDAERLDPAARATSCEAGGRFVRTLRRLRGPRPRARASGSSLTRWLATARWSKPTGRDAEGLIRELRPRAPASGSGATTPPGRRRRRWSSTACSILVDARPADRPAPDPAPGPRGAPGLARAAAGGMSGSSVGRTRTRPAGRQDPRSTASAGRARARSRPVRGSGSGSGRSAARGPRRCRSGRTRGPPRAT